MKREFDRDRIKIAVFDLDNTTFHNGALMPDAKDAIMRLRDTGVMTCIASGRDTPQITDEIRNCVDYLVTCNGAGLVRTSDLFTINSIGFENSVAHDVIRIIHDNGGISMLHMNGRIICQKDELRPFLADPVWSGLIKIYFPEYDALDDVHAEIDNMDRPVLKFYSFFFSQEIRDRVGAIIDSWDNTLPLRINPPDLEITAKGVSKASNLKVLCEYLGCCADNLIVFGDGYNDVQMFETAGFGVAMGNSVRPVLDLADYVTDDVLHAGVPKAIKALFGV